MSVDYDVMKYKPGTIADKTWQELWMLSTLVSLQIVRPA